MYQLTTAATGSDLRVGDVITFSSHYPWYKRLWFAIRYMRHNNPLYKPQKQFIITGWQNGNSYEIGEE